MVHPELARQGARLPLLGVIQPQDLGGACGGDHAPPAAIRRSPLPPLQPSQTRRRRSTPRAAPHASGVRTALRLPAGAGGCRVAAAGCLIGCLHCHCLCILVDLLVTSNVRTPSGRWESVMRHFLALPLASATLPPGMTQPTVRRLLVAPACR